VRPGTALFLLAYGVGVGIWAQRNDIPEKLAIRVRAALDEEARGFARVMTDEIHARHSELEAAKLLCRLTGSLW
jgi:hypothetical protein